MEGLVLALTQAKACFAFQLAQAHLIERQIAQGELDEVGIQQVERWLVDYKGDVLADFRRLSRQQIEEELWDVECFDGREMAILQRLLIDMTPNGETVTEEMVEEAMREITGE